jgi:Domain of unknown function (DUF4249)
MSKPYYLLLFIPFLTGCFDSELEFEDQFEPVLEAYLYADKAFENVKLSTMISFGTDSSGGDMITDATISLENDLSSWTLVHNDSLPGYYDLEETPSFSPGDTLKLNVELDDEVLIAMTVVPGNPPAVSKSSGSIYIPKVNDPREFKTIEMPDPLELTWDNPEGKYYFLHIQNIESNPISIRPEVPDGMPAGRGPGGFAFEMVTEPTNGTFYAIEAMQLKYYGTHRIIMTSVNDEYVNLYSSLNQDSRELNEPYSNVTNGLGIFTAFNSDTLYIEVIATY